MQCTRVFFFFLDLPLPDITNYETRMKVIKNLIQHYVPMKPNPPFIKVSRNCQILPDQSLRFKENLTLCVGRREMTPDDLASPGVGRVHQKCPTASYWRPIIILLLIYWTRGGCHQRPPRSTGSVSLGCAHLVNSAVLAPGGPYLQSS